MMQSIKEEEKLLLKLIQFRSFINDEKNGVDNKGINLLLEGLDLNYKFLDKIILEKLDGEVIGDILLHFAYKTNNIVAFNALISKGANFTATDKYGYTVLHKCFQSIYIIYNLSKLTNHNNKKDFADLIKLDVAFAHAVLSAHIKYNNTSNVPDPNGLTHFHIACTGLSVDAVEFFLCNGVSVNQAVASNRFKGYSPLHFATEYRHFDTAEMLLKYGAKINQENSEGKTPLHMCVEKNISLIDSTDIFHDMLNQNEAVMNLLLNFDTNPKFSHLFVASTMKDSYQVKSQLAQGADANQCISKDSKVWPGYTALHFAAHVNIGTVKLLLKHGANILAKTTNGVTPFDMCVDRYAVEDIIEIINLVFDWKDILLSDGKTKIIDLLFAFKNLQTMSNFLQKSKDKLKLFVPRDSPIWPGFTVLHLSVILSERKKCKLDYEYLEDFMNFVPDLDIVAECLKHGADVTAIDESLNNNKWTAIHYAFRLKKLNTVKLLLKYHRRLKNCVDSENLSHLHIACALGYQTLVEKFLWNDAYVNVSLNSGCTPLHVAVSSSHFGIVKLLLDFGANPYARDANSFTPIHLVINHKHPFSFKLGQILLSLPDLQEHLVENFGLSYLHVACWSKNVDAVKKLLDSGVNCSKVTSIVSHEGFTPLHFALANTIPLASQKSKFAKLEIVNLLIKRGADILVKNSAGDSPLAMIFGSEDHSELFDIVIESLENNFSLRKRVEEELGLTLLHLACYKLDFAMISKCLYDLHIPVNARVHNNWAIWSGYTALHVLLCNSPPSFRKGINMAKFVNLLLHRGADVTLSNAKLSTSVHVAHRIFCSELDSWSLLLVNQLLKAQIDFEVNPIDSDGISHFHIACQVLNVEVVKKFLEHDVDVNAAIDIFSASHLAACSPLLLAVKSNVTDTLFSAFDEPFSQLEVVNLLIKHGANVNVEDVSGNTPLHYAALRSDRRNSLAQLILRSGANVNAINLKGETKFS